MEFEVKREYMELISVNCPDLFKDPEFIEWLNRAADGVELEDKTRPRAATWHRSHEKVGEFSDVFMSVDMTCDGYAEGSDSDMPEHCWNAIIQALRDAGVPDQHGCIVWLKNLEV